jgi:ubiquinone/menaquinone biosynthesis C-methylase UbiE
MKLIAPLLDRAFGHPRGLLGRLGGRILARANREFAHAMIARLDVRESDRVLEIGFGPGVAVQRLADLTPCGHVSGVEPSRAMLAQARRRNASVIHQGRVELREGAAERLPYTDAAFDKMLTINTFQLWSDHAEGLREVRRVLRSGGVLAIGFTPYAGQALGEVTEQLERAGFSDMRVEPGRLGTYVTAINPGAPGCVSGREGPRGR